jgi:4a-hydroxytetrahydrobiopterin dehydratase
MKNKLPKLSVQVKYDTTGLDDQRILVPDEIFAMLKDLSGWKYVDNKITKEFRFPTFVAVVKFIDTLAVFCDRIDHHPDIHIYYTRVVFELQRFSVGGKVTPRDFAVAREIEKIYAKQNKK